MALCKALLSHLLVGLHVFALCCWAYVLSLYDLDGYFVATIVPLSGLWAYLDSLLFVGFF